VQDNIIGGAKAMTSTEDAGSGSKIAGEKGSFDGGGRVSSSADKVSFVKSSSAKSGSINRADGKKTRRVVGGDVKVAEALRNSIRVDSGGQKADGARGRGRKRSVIV
jgi:hypothetical protein